MPAASRICTKELSLVDGAAVGAGAFVADLAVAAAAEVAGAGTCPIAIEGQGDEGEAHGQREQGRQEREDKIDDHADGQQREQIEQGFRGRQELEGVIDDGDAQQQQGPRGAQEGAEEGRLREGVEGGMIEELHPLLGDVLLYEGIEQGRECQRGGEDGGVDAGDVIEQEHPETLSPQDMNDHDDEGDACDGQEPEDVTIGKEVDELADGVVGA